MLISMNNVRRYRRGKHILNGIDWNIKKGDKWILYGLNGAGKTTLLNILNAYDSITSGNIVLFGMTPGMVGYSADNVRQHIGFISNKLTIQFYDGEHVIDVVLSGYFKSIGLYKTFNQQQLIEAQKLLKLVGMAEFENEYLGYLSSGQQQRVMIARALISNPELLILDEPASGLDFLARETLLEVLETLSHERPEITIIYVTHFIEEIIPIFDKIFILSKGVNFAQGNIDDVLTNKTMSSLFNRNVEVVNYKNRFSLHMIG